MVSPHVFGGLDRYRSTMTARVGTASADDEDAEGSAVPAVPVDPAVPDGEPEVRAVLLSVDLDGASP